MNGIPSQFTDNSEGGHSEPLEVGADAPGQCGHQDPAGPCSSPRPLRRVSPARQAVRQIPFDSVFIDHCLLQKMNNACYAVRAIKART